MSFLTCEVPDGERTPTREGQLGHSPGEVSPAFAATPLPSLLCEQHRCDKGTVSNKGLLKSWRKQKELEQSMTEEDHLRSKYSLAHKLLIVKGRDGAGYSRTACPLASQAHTRYV